ncbi:GlxA family transcriptional regulator [Kocuria sp. NPDC057446]|uniref:GlxA family transcriptional regulator n=1 Tax=Kocuria sp. NPDC057446 TaxID=3346137 RepID=UPI0036AB31A0
MFHLSVPQMVCDEVARQGLGDWEKFLFGDRPGRVRTAEGYGIEGFRGLAAAAGADVLVMPSWFLDGRPAGAAVRGTLRAAHDDGATVVGLCLGAIPVADAGLLAGRMAVTHWQAFDLLAQRHPELALDESVLHLDHVDVLTSAGTASGLDACLHLVRSRLGSDAANRVARSLVIAPHRAGGQAQYIERRLLETTDRPIDTIAAACGIGSPVTLRQNFSAAFRTSPSQYRARFRAEAAGAE